MEEVKLPILGQSVEEAQIVDWLKQEGDAVQAGEPLLTVQTDKAEIEVEAPVSGVLRKILVPAGVDAPVLSVIALIGAQDEPLPALAGSGIPAPSAVQVPVAAPSAVAPSVPAAPSGPAVKTPGPKGAGVSPRARKRAQELHIDPAHLGGSGAGGRVIESDVQAYAAQLEAAHMTPTARRIAAMEGVDPAGLTGSGEGGRITKSDVLQAQPATSPPKAAALPSVAAGEVKRVPLTPMRKVIARRMCESKFSAPHYYVTVEVDMAAAKTFRSGLSAFKASFNDLVLFSAARALREFPAVNARWAGDAIEIPGDINLGVAVALPTGLIVPVLRNAQDLSLEGLCRAVKVLVEKAQNGKLMPDDYTGNTFTVSNLGPFGVDHFTAIINQPDSAILAVGQMKDRVVVVEGGMHIRPIMKLTLSSDHRVIDGAVAAQFMGRLKERLEKADFS